MCIRDWLADLSKINWEVVEATHNFAVILPVPLWSLQRYIRSENIAPAIAKFLYCDADAITFQLLRMNFSFDSRSSFTSIHAKTSVLQATWRGLVEGLQTGPQGDIRQQGGAFVLGADEIINGEAGGNAASTEADEGPHIKCLWAHYDRYNADQVQIPVLLMAAGLPHALYRH